MKTLFPKPKRFRRLHLEPLEERQMLSVSPLTPSDYFGNAPHIENNLIAQTQNLILAAAAEIPATHVTTLNDVVDPNDGVISLREAIAYAGTSGLGGTITFAPSLANQTITLNGNFLDVNKNITIDAGSQNITISGDGRSSIILVRPWRTVTLSGLTFINGRSSHEDFGGAITTYSRSQDFTMSASLAAGGFQTLAQNYNWGKLAAGTYTITVTLDVNDALSELQKGNNTASWEFTVGDVEVLAPTHQVFTTSSVYNVAAGKSSAKNLSILVITHLELDSLFTMTLILWSISQRSLSSLTPTASRGR
ncbi:MAG: CSLREA domain-containing protein [Planctomycetaceae bacterium]|nr:CSLREA domain-containing protein [Planctomycetaceae bacterium]